MNKVLFTASTASHLRNFHLPYLKWFQELGYPVHVAYGGKVEEIPWVDRMVPIPFRKQMGAPENFQAARALHDLVQEEGYSLISTHTSLAAFFTRLALGGLKSRPPVVNMVHGYLFDDETPFVRRAPLLTAERWMAARTDLLLVMNECDWNLAHRYRLGRDIRRIPGVGVDFSRLEETREDITALRTRYHIPEGAFVVLYAAEFSRRKNQAVLLRALTHLGENVVLILAGDGTTLPECRVLAEQLGVTGRVRFPGLVKDMGAWYRFADVVASGSRSEGLPFHIMEAMYMGLPVVASAVKGHVDLIHPGETGLLYPFDHAEACAGAIRALVDSPPLRKRLGAGARREVGQYCLESVFPQVVACYEHMLSLF